MEAHAFLLFHLKRIKVKVFEYISSLKEKVFIMSEKAFLYGFISKVIYKNINRFLRERLKNEFPVGDG